MTPRAVHLVLLPVVAATVVACGGGQGSGSSAADHAVTSTPSGAAVAGTGRALFADHCSVCHSLTGHDNARLQGGDLLGFHAPRAEVVQFVREMPVVHGPLNHDELQAVVDYVIAAGRRAQAR